MARMVFSGFDVCEVRTDDNGIEYTQPYYNSTESKYKQYFCTEDGRQITIDGNVYETHKEKWIDARKEDENMRTKYGICKDVLNAIEAYKNESISDAIKATRDMGLTVGNVLDVIDEEYITWCDSDGVAIDDSGTKYIQDLGFGEQDKILFIEEYTDGLFNVFLDFPRPLANDARMLIADMHETIAFIEQEITDLNYCEPSVAHGLLLHFASLTKSAYEISEKITDMN